MSTESEGEQLAWEGAPLGSLLELAWPLVASVLSFAIMNAVDTVFVAGLGPEPLAGLALGSTSVFLILGFSIGFLRAEKVLVAQARGAGRHHDIPKYLTAALGYSSLAALATVGLTYAFSFAMPWFAKGDASAEAAQVYVRIMGIAFVPRLLAVAIRQTRYGLGDTRSAMIATLSANVANVGFNYLFVIELGHGVAGAAWGTVLANLLELCIMSCVQWQEHYPLATTRDAIRDLVRLGVPSGAHFVAEFGAFAMITLLLSSFGAVELAAHQIALHVVHLSFLPAFALSEACSVLVGQAVGARRLDLVGKVALRTLALASTYTAACSLLLFGTGFDIASWFSSDHSLVHRTGQLLLIAALFQVADGAEVVAREALRGTGDVRYSAVVGITCSWVIGPPVTWWLGGVLGFGALGGWFALCAEIFVSAACLWHRLLGGGWRSAAARAGCTLGLVPA